MRQVTALLIFAVTVAACTSPAERQYNLAQEKVKESLKAPSTAKFQPFSEVQLDTNGRGNPVMKFWCEADNAMGVPIRSKAAVGFDAKTGGIAFVYLGGKSAYESPEEQAYQKAIEDSLMRLVNELMIMDTSLYGR